MKEADRDIKSIKLLQSKKIYPHAAYHFQQAVEKAAKGYVLAFGYLSKDELPKIHDTPMIFLKVFLERTGLKAFAEQAGSEVLRKRVSDAYDAMDDPVKRQKIARTEYHDVCKALGEIDKYGYISEQIPKLMQGIAQHVESSSRMPVLQLPLVFQTLYALVTLFILAAISFPHWNYTRYPDMAIKPDEYTIDLGIVRALPKMAKMLEKENHELMKLILQSS
jgi:HEPN domain-containing protein